MFYFISGELSLLEHSFAVVDAGGVGYKLTISGTTYSTLPRPTGNSQATKVKLYTHLSVREDGVELYGFSTVEELNIFRLLISVSGIGPKAALSLLTQFTPEKIALAISTEDKKLISKAQGIGPKTAARIILELKDKMHSTVDVSDSDDNSQIEISDNSSKSAEALDALLVLGFNRSAALDAMRTIDTDSNELEDIIRLALKKLMK